MPETFQSIWNTTVRRDPVALALIDAGTGKKWTRRELAAEADAWCRALPASTDLRGRIVVFTQPNGLDWWRLFLGLISVGAVPAPLDPGESPDKLRQIAQTIGASFGWHDNQLESIESPKITRRNHRHALLKLTSGSTGVPRIFKFTASQMLADGRQICATMGIRPDDLNLAVISFGHSYGLGNLVMPLIEQGTPILCASSALPQSLALDCARWRPTAFPAVPALLRLLAASEISADALASLRLVISAGALLPVSTAQAFHEKFQRRVHGFYGSSETGGICFDRSGDATLQGRSVGTPMKGVALEFRRGQRFSVASPAVTGRGHFSPSDRGELNEHGELALLGRTGRTVKIAGRRLDLGEIEAALRAVPGVQDAFVAVHPQRADALAAVVATGLDKQAIRQALHTRLPAWKMPDRLVLLKTFPLTTRGKTDTRALLKQLGHA